MAWMSTSGRGDGHDIGCPDAGTLLGPNKEHGTATGFDTGGFRKHAPRKKADTEAGHRVAPWIGEVQKMPVHRKRADAGLPGTGEVGGMFAQLCEPTKKD